MAAYQRLNSKQKTDYYEFTPSYNAIGQLKARLFQLKDFKGYPPEEDLTLLWQYHVLVVADKKAGKNLPSQRTAAEVASMDETEDIHLPSWEPTPPAVLNPVAPVFNFTRVIPTRGGKGKSTARASSSSSKRQRANTSPPPPAPTPAPKGPPPASEWADDDEESDAETDPGLLPQTSLRSLVAGLTDTVLTLSGVVTELKIELASTKAQLVSLLQARPAALAAAPPPPPPRAPAPTAPQRPAPAPKATKVSFAAVAASGPPPPPITHR